MHILKKSKSTSGHGFARFLYLRLGRYWLRFYRRVEFKKLLTDYNIKEWTKIDSDCIGRKVLMLIIRTLLF